MATSGTRTFTLDFDELTDQAIAIAGGQPADAHMMRLARRAFNLMTLDWANRGVNLWQVDSTTVSLVAGTATYSLGEDVLDVMDVSFRDNDSGDDLDTLMGRISRSDYAALVDKAMAGRPTTYMVQRLSTGPTLTVWPVPDSDNAETLSVWRVRRIEDVTAFSQNAAVPSRFLPAAVAGMAHYMAQVRPASVDMNRRQELEAAYERILLRAMHDDRERVPTYVRPDLSGYWRA